jgi:hypothetical protein
MPKPFNKSTWPKPNKSIEAALGRFIIAWNVLEQQMDFAIHEMTNLDFDISSCVTANLGTKAKLDMYQALAHSMVGVIGKPIRDEIDKLAGETANACGELRNFIIHGQPFQLKTMKGSREIWARFSARKGGVKGVFVRWNGPYIDKQVHKIIALVSKWEDTRTKTFEKLSLWYNMPTELRDDTSD